MDKRDTIYTVILALSLFSLSYIFFSNSVTRINVTVEDSEPVYVEIPAMFSLHQMIFIMVLTATGVFSFVYLYMDLSRLSERTNNQKMATKVLEGDEKALYKLILERKDVLQKDLVNESGFSKPKVTRLLEKLDRKVLINRKPFGHTNKISVKE